MFAFQRILVPTDFSDCSERALLAAIGFAARFDSVIHVLHVTDRPGSRVYEDNTATDNAVEALEAEEAALREAFGKAAARVADETGLPSIPAERIAFSVSGGTPADEIVRIAEDERSDLIVLGTHGRTSVKDFFVGSTAERVVKNANCAVLAIKPAGYPFLRD